MAGPHGPSRHTPERLASTLKLTHEHWKATSPPFFMGGGVQCDVYGFKVPLATIANSANFMTAKSSSEDNDDARSDQQMQKICLRIPRSTLLPKEAAELIGEEVSWRTKIAEHGIRGVQRMIRHDLTQQNVLNSPYIALEWADGKPLRWNDSVPEKQGDRQKVIKQVVEMTMGLLCIREEGCSATSYMQNLIDYQIGRITKPATESTIHTMCPKAQQGMLTFSSSIMLLTHTTEVMQTTQQLLLDRHIIPELDDAPHVLIHGDLGENNIIIDADHNVTLIDLGFMHLEPLQLSAYFPRFLTHEPSSADSDCPFDRRMEVAAWVRRWGQADTVQIAKDRSYYLECVREVAEGDVIDEKLEEVMVMYSRVLKREDEVERFWWMQSMQRIDIWLQMEKCGWEPRKGRDKEACARAEASGAG